MKKTFLIILLFLAFMFTFNACATEIDENQFEVTLNDEKKESCNLFVGDEVLIKVLYNDDIVNDIKLICDSNLISITENKVKALKKGNISITINFTFEKNSYSKKVELVINEKEENESITINLKDSYFIGDEEEIQVVTTPSDLKYEIKSSDNKILSINEKMVSFIGTGKANIIVTSSVSKKDYTFPIEVIEKPIKGIESVNINLSDEVYEINTSQELSFSIIPSNAKYSVSVLNDSIEIIDNTIYFKKIGSSQIIVKDENNKEFTFDITIVEKIYDIVIENKESKLYVNEEYKLSVVDYKKNIYNEATYRVLSSNISEYVLTDNIFKSSNGGSASLEAVIVVNGKNITLTKEIEINGRPEVEEIKLICENIIKHNEPFEVFLEIKPQEALQDFEWKLGDQIIEVSNNTINIDLDNNYMIKGFLSCKAKYNDVKDGKEVYVFSENQTFYLEGINDYYIKYKELTLNNKVANLLFDKKETQHYEIEGYLKDTHLEIKANAHMKFGYYEDNNSESIDNHQYLINQAMVTFYDISSKLDDLSNIDINKLTYSTASSKVTILYDGIIAIEVKFTTYALNDEKRSEILFKEIKDRISDTYVNPLKEIETRIFSKYVISSALKSQFYNPCHVIDSFDDFKNYIEYNQMKVTEDHITYDSKCSELFEIYNVDYFKEHVLILYVADNGKCFDYSSISVGSINDLIVIDGNLNKLENSSSNDFCILFMGMNKSDLPNNDYAFNVLLKSDYQIK